MDPGPKSPHVQKPIVPNPTKMSQSAIAMSDDKEQANPIEKSTKSPERKRVELNPKKDPWQQQKAEGDKFYARFQTYLSLGTSRSLIKAYHAMNGSKQGDRADDWSSVAFMWRWTERATAFDKKMAGEAVKTYQDHARDFQNNIVEFLAIVSGDAVEAVKNKDTETLRKIMPSHMSLLGKGNTGNFLINGHKQVFGEKQIQQQTVTVDWNDIPPEEPRTIDLNQKQPEKIDTKPNQLPHKGNSDGKTPKAGGFIELDD